jgi:general secretion pathway protein A
MYQSFFGLKDNPFRLPPDTRYLYLGPSHRDSLEALTHGIDERAGLLVLTAEPGLGKTMLLHTLSERLDPKITTAFIFYARLSFQDFLQCVLEDIGLKTTPGTSAAEYLTQFQRWLIEHYTKDGTTVIFIDEAQNLPLDLLANLPQLLALEFAGDRLVQIVLAGQPALHETLQHPTLHELRRSLAVTCTLAPFSTLETQAYIRYRFAVAGGNADTVFSPRTFKAISTCTGGIPRLIHTLCDNALLTNYATGEQHLSPRTIREAARELGFHSRPQRTLLPSRTLVAVLAGLVLLVTALYVVPPASILPQAWSRVQTATQHGYQVVRDHTRTIIPALLHFVKNLGGQQTTPSPSASQAEPEPTGGAAEPMRAEGFPVGNEPERHLEREEVQAIVPH